MIRLIAILLLFAVTGCGYQVPGRGGSVPEGVEVVYLSMFANQTLEPRLESELTDSVAEALSRVPSIRVVSDKASADTALEGSILSYSTSAIAYDRNDTIREYLARMVVDFKLRRIEDGRLLWQDKLSWKEPYSAKVDKSLQKDLEDKAVREINRRLAEEFLFRLLEDF